MALRLPPYETYPVLSNETVTIRGIQEADIPDLVDISFYDAQPAADAAAAWTMQCKIDADYAKGDSVHWAITDRHTNEIAGTCGYYRGLGNGTGELGCILKPGFRGKGYMTAAMALAIDFGIQEIGLDKIIAITTVQNLPAIRLLERLNFRKTADMEDSEVLYEWQRTIV